MYYPGKEKLVSLDVFKLYCREDVVRQAPADIDPDLWTDKGKLTELPEIPVGDVVLRETCLGPDNSEVMDNPEADVPMILDVQKRWKCEKEYMRGYKRRYTRRLGKKHFKRKRG